jgi:hypothetical protein
LVAGLAVDVLRMQLMVQAMALLQRPLGIQAHSH